MFEILHIIGKNVTEKPETIRLPHRPPPPAGFRGLVLLDPQRCIGCGLCAYVCVSESVTGASDEAQYHWQLRARALHLLRALRRPLPCRRAPNVS